MKLSLEQQRDANKLLKQHVINALEKIKSEPKRIPQTVINGSWNAAINWKDEMEKINPFLNKPINISAYSLRELIEKKKTLNSLLD